MFNSKLLGGILLIVGTSIGGGMLALPVATAELGLATSIIFMIACWFIMTTGALLVLEVNLRLPAGSNMVSMAKSTFGLPGQIVTWIAYLLLLYALLSAYISGGSNVLNGLLQHLHFEIPSALCAILFTLFFGLVIYGGVRSVDFLNRGLMFGKLGVYLILICIIAPNIHLPITYTGKLSAVTGSIMVLIASFGFASIVPSLREYFDDDIHALRRVIIFGSLIPLVCYILWNVVIMSALSENGSHATLISLAKSENAIGGLTKTLSVTVGNGWITAFFSFFTSVCMITAFLGVSLGLFDFLADGLKMKKNGLQGRFTWFLTFIPPLVIVLLSPGIYLKALGYAGACCVFLLLLLPALMAFKSRRVNSNSEVEAIWIMPGGNILLMSIVVVACFLFYLAWM